VLVHESAAEAGHLDRAEYRRNLGHRGDSFGRENANPQHRPWTRFQLAEGLATWLKTQHHRLTEKDIGERAVIRWRRPAGGSRDEIADVLGVLEAADGSSLRIRKASGELVIIPRDRALAGKTIPPPPRRAGKGRKEVTGDGR